MRHYYWLFIVSLWQPCSWAGVEITGINSFRYTDENGSSQDYQVNGVSKLNSVSNNSHLAAKQGKKVAPPDKELKTMISQIKPIKLETLGASEALQEVYDGKVAFIVTMNDGSEVLVFEFYFALTASQPEKKYGATEAVAGTGISSGASGFSSGATGFGSAPVGIQAGPEKTRLIDGFDFANTRDMMGIDRGMLQLQIQKMSGKSNFRDEGTTLSTI